MIRVDLEKCTGCKRCEVACAFVHTGKVSNHLARIKVLNLYEIGIDYPLVCQQCTERYCLCCPEDALCIGNLGQVIVSPTACTVCGACEKACPIGAIEIFNDLVFVCDLCGGAPKCIESCTEGAITYDSGAVEQVSLAVYEKEARKMSPEQKRHCYAKAQSSEVREKWRKLHA